MKNILTIAAIACASMATFSSCSDFLDEEPKSQLTGVAFYKTEAQAVANVNYLYRTGATSEINTRSGAYDNCRAARTGYLTGYFLNDYEGQELSDKYSRELKRQEFTMRVSNDMGGIWSGCYRAINVANGGIKHIPEIKMDENLKNKLIAEAKFFRAFNYFTLVKYYGAVPLSVEPYETQDNMYLERTSVEQVYAVIEQDLKDAMAALPATPFYQNDCRVGKYVAAMTLTAVYMQQGKYAEAAQTAKVVIDSPHKLLENDDLKLGSAFNKLRTQDGSAESIYAFEYNETISHSGGWTQQAFDAAATNLFNTYSIFNRGYGASDQFLNIYEPNDLRIQPNQFFHWEYTHPLTGKTWKSDRACNWFWYDEKAIVETGRGTKDRDIFRFAEALLDGAEAIAQSQGVTSEAANYLAQVQARANMEGKTVAQIAAELQKLGQQQFIEACWTERLREFPLEYRIWEDVLRTGKFPVISKTTKGQVQYVDVVGAKNGSGFTFTKSDLLWPLPISELQRNPKLTQNEGYQTE